jgi:cellulose synthase/poly-beta-1,6-N-acetylglucosamine synthase-like glycosyltransferase
MYNEEKAIEKTIKNVKKLIYPKKIEIIVIDDGSTDNTYKITKKIRGIKVLTKKHEGKAKALNFGLKYAKGEIVACVDADSYPEKNALMKTTSLFEKNVAAVTTSIFVKNAKSLIERLQRIEYLFIAWSRKVLEYLNSIYVTPGAMSLYRKKVLLKVGGFDEKNLTEDIEIAWRLLKHKYKIKMSLDTKVYTNVPRTLKRWWHQRLRWNVGGLQTNLKYFNLFLKKDFGSVGMFLLPFFSVSYLLSLLGLFLIFYSIFSWSYFLIGSYTFGFNPIGHFYILPDILLFLGIFVFILSLFYIKAGYKTMKRYIHFPKKILDVLIYVSFYFAIFPINLIHSFLKFLTGKHKW